MPNKEMDNLVKLGTLISDLNEKRALELTQQLIYDGSDPVKIIEYAHKGMAEVGQKYEKEIYFISGLVMAGEIMQQIGQMVLPLTVGKPFGKTVGKLLVGTVEGDIHYIGKDIFKAMLSGHGFTVMDLGVDVTKEKFLSGVQEFKPDIIGFSCLITACITTLAETITYLRSNIPKEIAPKAYLAGGWMMGSRECRTIGADLCTMDSMEGVRLCQKTMGLV